MELEGLNCEPAVARTTYSPCWLETETTELDITPLVECREAGKERGSGRCSFCVKMSEGRDAGGDKVCEEGDKDEEEEDAVWLLSSDLIRISSGMPIKFRAALVPLPLSVLVSRGRDMFVGLETDVLLLKTTAGRLLALASMAETICSATPAACCGCCCCTVMLGLVIT